MSVLDANTVGYMMRMNIGRPELLQARVRTEP